MPAGLRLRPRGAGQDRPGPCRLYGAASKPASARGPVHGVGRRRLPHLVGPLGVHERAPEGRRLAAAGTVPALA